MMYMLGQHKADLVNIIDEAKKDTQEEAKKLIAEESKMLSDRLDAFMEREPLPVKKIKKIKAEIQE